jgi:hypothetical protein
MNRYYILYCPGTYNLIEYVGGDVRGPRDMLSLLARRDIAALNAQNSLEFLSFDRGLERVNRLQYFPYENYGAYYVANQIVRADPSARVILADDTRRTIREVIAAEYRLPEIVFMTALSAQFPTAVAASITLNHAGIPVVLGGIHATVCPEDVDTYIRRHVPNPEIVSMVRGGCDLTSISRVLADARSGTLAPAYDGGAMLEDGAWGNPRVSALPPVRTVRGRRQSRIKRFIAPESRVNVTTPYVGCFHSCRFCSVGSLSLEKRRFRVRTPGDFLDELAHIQREGKGLAGRFFFFYPDNILAGGATLDSILDGIIARGMVLNFTVQAPIEIAENSALLDKMRRAGASCIFTGYESLEEKNLEYIGKKALVSARRSGMNIVDYYADRTRRIRDHGIVILGSFMFGLPYDRFNSLDDHSGRDVADFCREHGIGLQAACISDSPGSPAFMESHERGTSLYGPRDSIDYLLALSALDMVESNMRLPASVRNSQLVTAYMTHDALARVYTPAGAFSASARIARHAWRAPTGNGRTSLRERIVDTIAAFGIQKATSTYRDFYESIAFSRPGYRGVFKRLWEREKDEEVKRLFRRFVEKALQ